MKTTTNPIETCQACGQGVYPGESVLVLGPNKHESRAIHMNPGCFYQYKNGPESIQIIRIMKAEEWLEL